MPPSPPRTPPTSRTAILRDHRTGDIHAARSFQLTASKPTEDFGQSLVNETWEWKL